MQQFQIGAFIECSYDLRVHLLEELRQFPLIYLLRFFRFIGLPHLDDLLCLNLELRQSYVCTLMVRDGFAVVVYLSAVSYSVVVDIFLNFFDEELANLESN